MKRDWLPELAKSDTALATIGMRDFEKGVDFADRTSFPAERLYVDVDTELYSALGMDVVDCY